MAIIDPQVPRNIILGAFKEQILNFDRDYGTAATNESLTAIDALVDYGVCPGTTSISKID